MILQNIISHHVIEHIISSKRKFLHFSYPTEVVSVANLKAAAVENSIVDQAAFHDQKAFFFFFWGGGGGGFGVQGLGFRVQGLGFRALFL